MTDPSGLCINDALNAFHMFGSVPDLINHLWLDAVERAPQHGACRLPNDTQNGDGDEKTDDRIGERKTKGDARGAATALLANYRSNPGGERASDSLYYLGQALMKLGQPGQACKAYAELDAVYGAKIRPDLKKLETDAKAQAQCN